MSAELRVAPQGVTAAWLPVDAHVPDGALAFLVLMGALLSLWVVVALVGIGLELWERAHGKD